MNNKIKVILITIIAMVVVYFVTTHNSDVTTAMPKNSSDYIATKQVKKRITNSEFISKILSEEPKAKDAFITDVKVLYISVVDDGTNRNGLASYFCDRVKESGVDVVRVKIVKAGSTNDSNRNNSYGILLGEYWCK